MNKLALLLLIFSFNILAGGLEEQRKYVFEKISPEFNELITKGQLKGLSVKNHSTYTYYDIYLDTEDNALYKNNLVVGSNNSESTEGSAYVYSLDPVIDVVVQPEGAAILDENDFTSVKLGDRVNVQVTPGRVSTVISLAICAL